jgi:23S rRNA (guanosine2251-2'-O)-methyltransferase
LRRPVKRSGSKGAFSVRRAGAAKSFAAKKGGAPRKERRGDRDARGEKFVRTPPRPTRERLGFDGRSVRGDVDRSEENTHENDQLLYGIHPILEALKAKPTRLLRIFVAKEMLNPRVVDDLIRQARAANVRVDLIDKGEMPDGVHQGVAADVRPYAYVELEALIQRAKDSGRPPLLVLLDSIQDPHNLGAIIRSAYAFGAHGVVVTKDRAAQVTGLVAKLSAGAVEHIPIARVVNLSRALETLKAKGLWIAAADPQGKASMWQSELNGPIGLVVGAEGPGIRDGVLNHCDFRVQIPMAGKVASLNASVSAAVLLSEIARQRANTRS